MRRPPLNQRITAVLALDASTAVTLARQLSVSARAVRAHLQQLEASGRVYRYGVEWPAHRPGRPRTVWRLTSSY